MGQIVTEIGEPQTILKTGGVAWAGVSGAEQLSVVIPIAFDIPATGFGAFGITLNLSLAIAAGGGADGNVSFDIYPTYDNSTKDTDPVVALTLTTLLAATPDITTKTYRMEELGPSIIVGLTRDSGTRVITPTLVARRWYLKQAG